jgi:acetyl esterase/lipase
MTSFASGSVHRSLSTLALLASMAVGASAWADSAIQLDVVYGTGDGQDLKLDVAVPPTGDGPFPMLVFIHGGGWTAGSKSQYDPAILACANQGYVAATVEYRFAPQFHFPAQIEDVKCAVRYLRAHALQLKGDAKRFGAVGESAGGHLALLLGLMDPKDGLDGKGGWPDQPSKVQVVVNWYGPSDLRTMPESDHDGVRLVAGLLGTSDVHTPLAALASPITYLDSSDAPVLTLHGGKDTLVPVSQSHLLHEALARAGVEEHLEIFVDAGHGFGGADAVRALTLTKEFLDRHLNPR